MNVHPEVQRIMPSARLAAREAHADRHIPITRFIRDGAFITRNGDVMGVIALDGLQQETSSDSSILAASDALARLAASFEDSCTAIYTHTIRHRIDLASTLTPVEGDGFEAQVDRHYRAQLQGQDTFRVAHYVTIVRHLPETGNRSINKLLRWSRETFSDPVQTGAHRKNREAFRASYRLALELLAPFGPRAFTESEEDRSEILTLLSMLESGVWNRCPPTWSGIGDHIPFGRITFRKDRMDTASPFGDQDRSTGMLAIRSYPAHTSPDMFNELVSSPVEFILTQCFRPLDRIEGNEKVKFARKSMSDAGDDAISIANALKEAQDEIASRTLSIGRHHFSLAVIARDPDELSDILPRVSASLAASGIQVQPETIGLELAWWAQMPGNFPYQTRSTKRFISNKNFAHFTAPNTWPKGDRDNLRWGGPVTAFQTGGGTPYWFSFHRGGAGGENGPGTTAVFGAPGEGKTFLVNFLLANCARLPEKPDIIAFDKDRGSEPFIRAIGGRYITLRPGENHGFNPFAVATDEEGADWLEGFVQRLARLDEPTPEQERRIAEAAQRNAASAPDLRTFRDFVDLLRSVDDTRAKRSILDGLSEWHSDGERAWLFDNDEDSFSLDQRVTAFDMTALLEADKIRAPVLDYLFFRIQRKLRAGKPTIILLDEAWRLLDDERFASRIRDWIKTIRKLNGIVVFMTQEASDAAKSSVSDTLIQSTENRIFFPNPEADDATYCDKFHLTKGQVAKIRSMPPKSRTVLFKNTQHSLMLSTRIDAPKGILKVLSGTASSVEEMDRLIVEHGPDGWLAPFMNLDPKE